MRRQDGTYEQRNESLDARQERVAAGRAVDMKEVAEHMQRMERLLAKDTRTQRGQVLPFANPSTNLPDKARARYSNAQHLKL